MIDPRASLCVGGFEPQFKLPTNKTFKVCLINAFNTRPLILDSKEKVELSEKSAEAVDAAGSAVLSPTGTS